MGATRYQLGPLRKLPSHCQWTLHGQAKLGMVQLLCQSLFQVMVLCRAGDGRPESHRGQAYSLQWMVVV